MAERLLELVERHNVENVYVDAAGPAGSVLHMATELGVKVEAVSAPDHAKACGLMFDTVDERALRHLRRARVAAGGEGGDEASAGGRVGVVAPQQHC